MMTTKTMRATLLGATIAALFHPGISAAQEMDHSKMHMPVQEPKAPAEEAAQDKPAAKDAHAGHAGHAPSPQPTGMDHSTMGHDMDTMQPPAQPMDHSAMDHEGMKHEGMQHQGMHVAPRQPHTPIPVLTDADRAAAMPPPSDHPVHDNSIYSFVLIDRLEAWNDTPGTGIEWDAKSWIGTDRNKLWLRTEGERFDGQVEAADLEVLYGRSIARWWDVVAGVRHDFKPGHSEDFLAIGVMGLAPYKFEVEATGYIGESGQTAARLEVEYETLLTNRLVLQPLVEANLHGQNDERRSIGSGLSTIEAGARLRYEITRQFAPYIGVVHERAFGRTADFRRDDGVAPNDTRVVAGIRIWF